MYRLFIYSPIPELAPFQKYAPAHEPATLPVLRRRLLDAHKLDFVQSEDTILNHIKDKGFYVVGGLDNVAIPWIVVILPLPK